MAAAFDPYHQWLGIPPGEQPPNHYRLLAIALFESDPAAIVHAADQRMAHIHAMQGGPHALDAQRLLSELAAARVCLLNPQRKAEYDEKLRLQLAAHSPVAKAAPPPVRRPSASGVGLAPPIVPAAQPQADQPTAAWSGLSTLGDYQLLEKLDEGGMGAVYRAVHTKLKRPVAVKVLPREKVQNPQARARFEREMQAAGAVDHPHVVRGLDAREVDGTVFLVMELVEGLNLAELLRRTQPLAVTDACELARQAALGLQAVHEHGLVHRDVKPRNLMLSQQGQVKLLDLGLARFEMDSGGVTEDLTGTGVAMGTLDYIAPEQLSDSRSVDIRADIYSLGCTLFHLLTGRPPFADVQGAAARMAAHAKKPAPRLRRCRGDAPQPLAALLQRMLAKDPARRPATPGELADALTPFCLGSHLPALLARAEGRPQARPPAERDTENHSTGLTRFLRRVGATSGPVSHGHDPSHPSGTRRKLAGGIVLAAVALLMLLVFVRGPGEKQPQTLARPIDKPAATQRLSPAPRQTEQSGQSYLIIDLPAAERADARLEVDGHEQDFRKLADVKHAGMLRLSVRPGPHRIWITRRGFQPFEQSVMVVAGRDLIIQPAWPALAQPAAATDGQPAVVEVSPAQPASEPAAAAPARAVDRPPGLEQTPAPARAAPVETATPAAIDPAEQTRREAEARYAAAVEPVEALASAWDFDAAVAALARTTFSEPALMERRNARGRELQRLAAFKKELITRLNAVDPPPGKSALMLKGGSGKVSEADQRGITVELAGGKTELHLWGELSPAAVQKILSLIVKPQAADDWIAAGLLSLTLGDASRAERALDKARSLGADVDPYLAALARTSLVEAETLVAQGLPERAEAVLLTLAEKYGSIPWFAANRPAFDAALARVRAALGEVEAEKLYAAAVKLYEDEELFELHAIVTRLRARHAESKVVADATRTPPFSELEEAVAALGKLLTVRQDGKGDFRTVQEALDAAPVNSRIEIQDSGPYNERIEILNEGITLCGRKGVFPVITSVGAVTNFPVLVTVRAERTSLDGLIFLHHGAAGGGASCVQSTGPHVLIRRSVFSGTENVFSGGPMSLETCIVIAANPANSLKAKDSVFVAGLTQTVGLENTFVGGGGSGYGLVLSTPTAVRHCTFTAQITIRGAQAQLRDSIFPVVQCDLPGTTIEHCNVYGTPPFIDRAKPGKGCFAGDPLLADVKNLDFRLKPSSPCIGKASDGGDIGCRYTSGMVEMCRIALELRARGLAKW